MYDDLLMRWVGCFLGYFRLYSRLVVSVALMVFLTDVGVEHGVSVMHVLLIHFVVCCFLP